MPRSCALKRVTKDGARITRIARELAEMIDGSLANEAFLCGIVHDMGILVMLQTIPEKLAEVLSDVPWRIEHFGSQILEVLRRTR